MRSDSDERDAPSAVSPDAALAVTEPAPQRPGPARHPSDSRIANQRVRAALAASTRTEATLSGLMRAVQEVTSGLNGAREANDQLARELDSVREALNTSVEEKTAVEVQLASLVVERDHALRELEQTRADAERERSFLIEEQDRFLAALLDDHEQTIHRLQAERDELVARAASQFGTCERTTAPGVNCVTMDELPTDVTALQKELIEARATIERCLAERTRSLETLRRLQAQRDEAQRALAAERMRGSTETGPAPTLERATPVYDAPAPEQTAKPNPSSKRTDPQNRKPANRQNSKRTNPQNSKRTDPMPRPRREPGPAEPSRAQPTQAPGIAQQAGGPSAAPLKRKPDPTSMPLGGYSLGSEDVPTEHVEGARFSSPLKPPRH